MGISGLSSLLKKKAPTSMRPMHTDELNGKSVAVDISIWLHQFAKTNFSIEQGICNDDFIRGVHARCESLTRLGANPIFVFDGKPPVAKLEELRQRRERLSNLRQRSDASVDEEIKNKLARQSATPTPELILQTREYLEEQGLVTFSAPAEAEAQCAKMCKDGTVWAVISEDMDTLVFGAHRLIRNFNSTACYNGEVQIVELANILAGLELEFDEFVDLCILCGCDYTSKLSGVACMTAYKLVKECGTIEKIITKKLDMDAERKSKLKTKLESKRVNGQYTRNLEHEEGMKDDLAKSIDNFKFSVARNEFNNPEVSLEKPIPKHSDTSQKRKVDTHAFYIGPLLNHGTSSVKRQRVLPSGQQQLDFSVQFK